MSKFLIEVPHEEETVACATVVQVFLASGSHFLTHADWGCMDGEHAAWMIVDVDTKAEALAIVPLLCPQRGPQQVLNGADRQPAPTTQG